MVYKKSLLLTLLALAFILLHAPTVDAADPKPKFQSKLITANTPGHSVDIAVDIKGAKNLYLVVTDGGNGYGADWADWIEPKLIGPQGEKKLTDLKWKSAKAGWGNVAINKNASGGPLNVNGKPQTNGIGTQHRGFQGG